jgi:hypothetical protein
VKQRGDVLFQNFGISRPKGGEDTKFELWHIETPDTRNSTDHWIKGEFTAIDLLKRGISGISVIRVSGFRESRSRVARHRNSRIRESRKAEIDIRKGQVFKYFGFQEVEEVRRSTKGFAKSRNPISQNKGGIPSRCCCG